MAGLDGRSSLQRGLSAVSIMIMGACSSGAPAPLEPPAGTSASAPAVESQPATEDQASSQSEGTQPQTVPEVPAAPAPPEVTEDSSVVVIENEAKDVTAQAPSLVEAARAERLRRQQAEPTEIVITDKNLAEYATGELTSAASQVGVADPELTRLEREMAEREAYWRGRAREIRQAWRDAYDQIPQLEEKVFQLRQAFYREDDGFYRDAEIKPAWDRAIDQLEQAHREVEARQQELEEFLQEGRASGALPGWLREGIDLEPETPDAPRAIAEPGEPVIYTPESESSDPP